MEDNKMVNEISEGVVSTGDGLVKLVAAGAVLLVAAGTGVAVYFKKKLAKKTDVVEAEVVEDDKKSKK